MTPEQVRACRKSHRINSGDYYSATGIDKFVKREEVMLQLAEEAADIEEILKYVPEFNQACDYHWAADPNSYDVPSEAAFQRRMLLMLAKYWVESDSKDRPTLPEKISGIITLQEFVMQYGLATPRIKTISKDCSILSLPAGFSELALWTFTGLRCWCSLRLHHEKEDNIGGWLITTEKRDFGTVQPFDHVTTKELIARTLADIGKDRSLYGVNSALLIREKVPSLSGEGVELKSEGLKHFEQNASYMLSEFCLAHELGHKLAGNHPSSHRGAIDQNNELEADHFAILLLSMSAGKRPMAWGDDLLPPWVQAVIGLAVFNCFLSVKSTLVNGVKLREQKLRNASYNDTHLFEDEKLRLPLLVYITNNF